MKTELLTTFSNLAVSKARKPKFELILRIIDLNNVPLTSGTCHVKWHITSSITADHRGMTAKIPIKEHKASWDYSRTVPVRLTIDKSSRLQECMINLEVIQEYSGGGRRDKIVLGFVELNLAEYVEESELGAHGEDGVTRRYLMQQSKINSTLKIGIRMKQIEGEKNFVAPPLKTAAVFGGIAGIMGGEQVEPDDPGHMPSISNKWRDNGELQDLYLRNLAASFAADDDILPPEEFVEDIFNGGDGFRKKKHTKATPSHFDGENSPEDGRRRTHHDRHHHRTGSGSSVKSQSTITEKGRFKSGHRSSNSRDGRIGGISPDGNDSSSENAGRMRQGRKNRELSEFDLREDLRSWELPSWTVPSDADKS